MRLHAQSRHHPPQCPSPSAGRDVSPPPGFLAAWARLVGARGVPAMPRRRGRKPRVPLTQLLPALTFHVMQGAGTLAEHFSELFDDTLGRQFVGRPPRPPAVGHLCRVDAARLAAPGDAAAARRVLARAGAWSPSMARNSA